MKSRWKHAILLAAATLFAGTSLFLPVDRGAQAAPPGRTSPHPELPAEPRVELPGVELPGVGEPGAPEIPGNPEIPGEPEVPGVGEPGVELPREPEVPGVGEQPGQAREALIAEVQANGRKISPERVVRIARDGEGKIVFLELGRGGQRGSGLQHIIEDHAQDFARRGISEEEIPDAVMAAVTQGEEVGMQGSRPIYRVEFNGREQLIAVTVGDNGYIVGANPASEP